MVRLLVGLKARLTWNGFRSDLQRRIGLPVAIALLTWAGIWLARSHYETATFLLDTNPEALASYLAWSALFLFLVWVTLPVIIFPLDENLDPQQLATLPITPNRMVVGLAAASLVAPSTVVPLLLVSSNTIGMDGGWWMALPAAFVFIGLLAIGGQLFSATISGILRTRRGRDIATFLVLGLAAGSFFVYRSVSRSIAETGIADVVLSHPIIDWWPLIPPVAAQKAMISAAAGEVVLAVLALAVAVFGLLVLAWLWRRLLG
ncbi:MAG: hypothetical protein M3N43_05045, partial [Actinomycetota bacterium]|nr:hypothetical protein [Actinomycetota bacterium]